MTLEMLAAKLKALMDGNPLAHDCKGVECATCQDLNDLWQIASRNVKANQASLVK